MNTLRATGIFILSILIFTGCSDMVSTQNDTQDVDTELTLKSKKNPKSSSSNTSFYNMGSGAKTGDFVIVNGKIAYNYEYVLWAGKDSEAGTVLVSYSNDGFLVTYQTNSSAQLGEVHVYVWENEGDTPNRRPAPGKAPYKAENLNTDSYTLEVSYDNINCGETFYISTHAALVGPGSNAGETAYAGGDGFGHMKGGSWWGFFEHEVDCFDPN
ncbi:MAG: hypothetical protein JJ895_15280 [Balneolaceae bacterium]|nr:hypothetical protein [Balneolaceae bacterium]